VSLRLSILVTIALVSGCAVSTDSTVMGGRAPTTGKVESETKIESNLPGTIAVLPFANKTDSEFAFRVVRRTMANHFSTKNYRMLHWRDVDNRLSLAGIDGAAAMDEKSPAQLREILGVDGLLYGNITHFNKTFAGIYAQVAVGVELRFLNADDEVVWEVRDVRRSHAGGVSTNPVGLILNALLAAKHLYGDINLYRAADDLGRDLAKDMPEPPGVSRRSKPVISNVVHSGVDQFLKYGDTLDIGVAGAPGMTAVASIEGIGLVDLKEQEPGQYIGKVALDKKLNLTNIAVIGRLQDDFGQTSSWVSPYGLLNIDNTPPHAVSNLGTESRNGAIRVSWQAPMDGDVTGYRVSYANTETGAAIRDFQSSDSNLELQKLRNFQTVYISVTAYDRAGNPSEVAKVAGVPAPDPRFGAAVKVSSSLPVNITGVNRLVPEGNPYHLRNRSRIATDGVLLIAPGVEIIVSANAKLSVLGEIHAFGNREHPIMVRDDNGQVYDEFLVLQSTQAINLQGLNITNAGIPIQITAGKPLIGNCSLINSAFNALTISGSARPVIRNCIITGAKASGVIVSGQAQPVFQNNQFANNDPFHVQNGSSYPVDMRDNTFTPAASNTTILGDVTY
jgi:hypothetical protein